MGNAGRPLIYDAGCSYILKQYVHMSLMTDSPGAIGFALGNASSVLEAARCGVRAGGLDRNLKNARCGVQAGGLDRNLKCARCGVQAGGLDRSLCDAAAAFFSLQVLPLET
jgi:hypothetical protein